MRGRRFLAALLTPFMMLLNCPVMAAPAAGGTEAKPATEIFHKPIETADSGKRLTVYAEVEDPSGIDVVRVYFKSQDAVNYNFVHMVKSPLQEKGFFENFKSLGSTFKGLPFSAVLPAPAKGSKAFDYLLLIKNKAHKVVKSQSYQVTVVDDKYEAVASKEPIKVYTELADVPKELPGFTDSITLDVVESGAKFGAVAGLYSTLTSGGGGAVAGGTVAASAGGFTTTAAVIGGVAAVAVVAGAAAVAGGGGGSGDSSGTSSSGTGGSGTGQTTFEIDTQNFPGDCANLSNVASGRPIVFQRGVGRWPTISEAQTALAGQSASIRIDGSELGVYYEGITYHGPGGYGNRARANWTTSPGSHTVTTRWTINANVSSCTFTISP